MKSVAKGNYSMRILKNIIFFLAGFIAGVVLAVILVISSNGNAPLPLLAPPPKAGCSQADGLPCYNYFSSPSSEAGRYLTGGQRLKESAGRAAINDTHIFTSLLRRGSSPIAALPNLKTQGPPEARQGQGLRKQGGCVYTPSAVPALLRY